MYIANMIRKVFFLLKTGQLRLRNTAGIHYTVYRINDEQYRKINLTILLA